MIGHVGAKVMTNASDIAKQIISQITSITAKSLGDYAKLRIPDGHHTVKDLHALVDELGGIKRDLATNLATMVGQVIDGPANEIARRAKVGQALSAAQNDFITPFILVGPLDADSVLERNYGIPSGANARELHLDIYEKLVLAFELKMIPASASGQGKLEMGFAADPGSRNFVRTVEGQALLKALEARNALEHRMKTQPQNDSVRTTR